LGLAALDVSKTVDFEIVNVSEGIFFTVVEKASALGAVQVRRVQSQTGVKIVTVKVLIRGG